MPALCSTDSHMAELQRNSVTGRWKLVDEWSPASHQQVTIMQDANVFEEAGQLYSSENLPYGADICPRNRLALKGTGECFPEKDKQII